MHVPDRNIFFCPTKRDEILVVYSGDMSVGVGTKESGKLQENSSVQSHLVTVNAQFFS